MVLYFGDESQILHLIDTTALAQGKAPYFDELLFAGSIVVHTAAATGVTISPVAAAVGVTDHVGFARSPGDTSNLIPDPTFDSPIINAIPGWYGNGGTVAPTSSNAQFGSTSLQVTNAAVQYAGAYFYSIAATAGQTYTLSAYVNVPVGQPTQNLSIGCHHLDNADTILNQSWSSNAVVTASGTFQRISVTFVANAGTTKLRFYVIDITSPTAAAGIWLLDGVKAEVGSTLTPFIPITTIPAAAATVTKPATATAVTVTPTTTAALGAKTIPVTTIAVTVTPTTAASPSAMTKTTTAAQTVVALTTSAAGYVTDTATAATTITPTTAASGTVAKSTTALAVTVTPTTSAVPSAMSKSITATATSVVPTTAAVAAAIARTSSAQGVTITPTVVASGETWRSRFFRPDAILSMSGLTGTVSEIQDSPTSPDGSALDPTGGAVDVRFSFENHGQTLRTNTGDQKIRVLVSAP